MSMQGISEECWVRVLPVYKEWDSQVHMVSLFLVSWGMSKVIYAVAVSVCFPTSGLCAFSPHLHQYWDHLLSFLKFNFESSEICSICFDKMYPQNCSHIHTLSYEPTYFVNNWRAICAVQSILACATTFSKVLHWVRNQSNSQRSVLF